MATVPCGSVARMLRPPGRGRIRATHERGGIESPLAPVASTPHRLRAALSPRSTPGSFRLTATVVTALCAVCAVVAAAAIVARAGSLDAAGTEAQQLVDLQEIRTVTIEADAIAASSFLGGGEQAATQQADYEARLGDATRAAGRRRPAGDDLRSLQRSPPPTTRSCATADSSSRPGPTIAKASRSAPPTSAKRRTSCAPTSSRRSMTVDAASRDRLNDSLSESTRQRRHRRDPPGGRTRRTGIGLAAVGATDPPPGQRPGRHRRGARGRGARVDGCGGGDDRKRRPRNG